MGGAAFPTVVKLSPPKEKPIDTVIINGSECEPYLTGDYRLMIERPKEILEGLRILMKVLGVSKGFVGIEDNKPAAINSMKETASGD
jgi:Na+-translocating ferredoxin:NAD+ oxidoreductase subunit C